ncbi:hypothetical protein D083_1217 [Dickeya solani RNS 08.23.3.1.A]|nr:hypothetical protein D083_1217 [Dickeya solani RNS 08.23.3.1.A]
MTIGFIIFTVSKINMLHWLFISPVAISHEIYFHFIIPSTNCINVSKKIPRKINYLTHQS